MAGKTCPKCGEQTLWQKGRSLKCSRCNYEIHTPTNNGMGGKGKRCPVCGRYTWFEGVCNSCGTRE